MPDRAFFLFRTPEAEPYALAARNTGGEAELFVPGSGWQPMPPLTPHLANAVRVCADRAQQLINDGVGPRLTSWELAALRGR